MHALEIFMVVIIFLSFFLLVFGIVYLKKRENLAMLDKGLNPRVKFNRPAPYANLKWGLLLIGAGVGLAFSYFVTQYMLHDYENPALWFASIAVGGGVGLVSSYRIEKKELLPPASYDKQVREFEKVQI